MTSIIYYNYKGDNRCRCLTHNKSQCNNKAIYKSFENDDIIYCGIHYNSLKKKYNISNNINKVDYNERQDIFIRKIQKLWKNYKNKLFSLVQNNGIKSENDTSILTLEKTINLKDSFIYYKIINNKKLWFMESVSNMYNWYNIQKQNKNQVFKCVYTNEQFSEDEKNYIVAYFNKIKKNNKYLKTSIIKHEILSLYETILKKCNSIFTDSADSIYIDTFIKLSNDAIYRLISELYKVFLYSNITNIFSLCGNHMNKINKEVISALKLQSLYKKKFIKLKDSSPKTSQFFYYNKTKLEKEYKTLKLKEYFVNEIIDKYNSNPMLMYYIKSPNIWFFAITTLYFEDIEANDTIVNEFYSLPVLNNYYNNSIIK